MTVLLATSMIVCILGLMLVLTSRSAVKNRLGHIIFKVGILLLVLCTYLITKDYKFILLYIVFAMLDFFVSLTFLSEKIKGEDS